MSYQLNCCAFIDCVTYPNLLAKDPHDWMVDGSATLTAGDMSVTCQSGYYHTSGITPQDFCQIADGNPISICKFK